MKSIIIISIIVFSCFTFNEALKCYSHDACSTNCPQLTETITTCTGDDNKCYKAAFPGGVARGCGKDRCNVQVNANSMMASVCCETDLCNSAIKSTFGFSTIFMLIFAFILARM